MKKLVLLLGMGMLLPTAANADLVHRLTTSTQLTVDGAATQSTRIGSTYSVSGNNIKVASADDHFGKLTAPSGTAAATLDAGTYDINTAGAAFSFTESLQNSGLSNITTINRTTTTESLVESVSVFCLLSLPNVF